MKAGILALEPGFRRFRAVIDEALRQKIASDVSPNPERLVPPCTSWVAGRNCRLLSLLWSKHKNTGLRSRQPVLQPDLLATCFTWLQAGRPNHHGISCLLGLPALASIDRLPSRLMEKGAGNRGSGHSLGSRNPALFDGGKLASGPSA
jgi:hypothetical protein